MAGPIDAVLKPLTELSPADWAVRGGWPAAAATVIDADIATLSGAVASTACTKPSTTPPTWACVCGRRT